jgi:DNA-binding response OmpR family regulator
MATVLILEDNVEIATIYERIFFNHKTCILPDVPEAISYLKAVRPDLVITDFHLPSGSGMDVINYMRSQTNLKNVPILGVSVDDLLKDQAKDQGMDEFLMKPIELKDLIDTAQRLISGQKRAPSGELREALDAYAAAYKQVYGRMPTGRWTGTQVMIDDQPCDIPWLQAETRRLRSLMVGGEPRNYLMRLLDKVRRL